ncbi:hypothetical protein CE91St36_23040 [Christensenellaceae bacterium]|nr:hypothetical protein CE91St36_23040 [Christensenellaceae bacterium]BDF62152.1 hypothetical protein CE91St37_23020 [Christensenellaceae bacterium]
MQKVYAKHIQKIASKISFLKYKHDNRGSFGSFLLLEAWS